MSEPDSSPTFERDAATNLWRHTLSQVPSLFGRLVYLSALRDQNTGTYEHYGLAQVYGEGAADRVLRASHMKTFSEWLCLRLEEQKGDLDLYLSGLEGDRRAILDTWIRLHPYRNLVPSGARQVERDLYMGDLETILELLRNEYGVACPDPDA